VVRNQLVGVLSDEKDGIGATELFKVLGKVTLDSSDPTDWPWLIDLYISKAKVGVCDRSLNLLSRRRGILDYLGDGNGVRTSSTAQLYVQHLLGITQGTPRGGEDAHAPTTLLTTRYFTGQRQVLRHRNISNKALGSMYGRMV